MLTLLKSPFELEGAFSMKKTFTTKNIAGMAVFSALSFVIYLLEIPIFASTPASFLKLDFSNVFVALAGFMYGPIPAIIITVIKEAIHIPIGGTGGIGELANTITTIAFVIIPSIVYKYRKGIKPVIFTLLIAIVMQIGVSLLANKFINFPFFISGVPFAPTPASDGFFNTVWTYVLAFNAIKATAISILTILLYKRVSKIFKKIKLQNS